MATTTLAEKSTVKTSAFTRAEHLFIHFGGWLLGSIVGALVASLIFSWAESSNRITWVNEELKKWDAAHAGYVSQKIAVTVPLSTNSQSFEFGMRSDGVVAWRKAK